MKYLPLLFLGGSLFAQCGPPSYPCTTSSTAVVQTPAAPFTATDTAGTVRYDTSLNPFGVDPILELSDNVSVSGVSLNTSQDGGDNGEQGSCAGRTDTTTDCKTSSIFLDSAISGGCTYVAAISVITKEPTLIAPFPATGTPNTGLPCGDYKFSHTGNWEGFKLTEHGDPVMYKVHLGWDNIKGHPVTSTQTLIFDTVASCPLPAGFAATWVGELSFDISDKIFWFAMSNAGGQGTGTYQIRYDASQPNCTMLNTATGAVRCKGRNCKSQGQLINGCHLMTIHNSNSLRNGEWVAISGASTGMDCGDTELFWDGSTNAIGCAAKNSSGGSICKGHDAHGFSLLAVIDNPYFYLINPATANTAKAIVPFGKVMGNIEDHFSWRNATAANTQAIVGSTANRAATWTEPGQNEDYILLQDGTLKRPGHNFILGDCTKELFEGCYAIGQVSQGGHYFTKVSSMSCSLGIDAKGFCKQRIYLTRLD